MKLLKQAVVGLLVLVVVAAFGAGCFFFGARPLTRPATTEVVEKTPARLARGTYLAEHLLSCRGCHSTPNPRLFGLQIPPGAEFAGGMVFDRSIGLPGVLQPPNITPDVETGIGGWSDGEVMRAIREGIHKSGRALFPMMPYRELSGMADEDLRALVVYLRALPPVSNKTRRPVIDFPASMFVRAVPQPVEGVVVAPNDAKDHLAYGAYLVRLAGCGGCHTPMEYGRPIEGREFAGGRVFKMEMDEDIFHVVSANITPDPTGYFGPVKKDAWINRVRGNASLKVKPLPVSPSENTLMPWTEYSGLTDGDLGAIYDYLRTVPPVRNTVVTFPRKT